MKAIYYYATNYPKKNPNDINEMVKGSVGLHSVEIDENNEQKEREIIKQEVLKQFPCLYITDWFGNSRKLEFKWIK